MEGTTVPFCYNQNKHNAMIDRKKIEGLIDEKLSGTDRFLVELKISEANNIQVFIDSDSQVSISDCVQVSRQIESNLDREEEDFELHVSSAGLDTPLRTLRQYKKHIGQMLRLKMKDGSHYLLQLEEVNDEGISGIPLKKNPNAKKGAPKQYKELEKETIPFQAISETKIEVVF